MSKAKKIYQGIVTCLTILFFILAIYIIVGGTIAAKNNDMFSIFGYTYSVVPTKSMEPEIKVGDSVIAKKVKYDTLKIGDDVVYYSEALDIYIVHRIIRQDAEGFKTKGINNPTEDEGYVTEDNFISKVTWHGNAGNIGTLVLQHRGTIFLVLTAILLLIAINGIFDIVKIIHKDKLEKLDLEKEKLKSTSLEIDKEALRQEVIKELEEENKNKEE